MDLHNKEIRLKFCQIDIGFAADESFSNSRKKDKISLEEFDASYYLTWHPISIFFRQLLISSQSFLQPSAQTIETFSFSYFKDINSKIPCIFIPKILHLPLSWFWLWAMDRHHLKGGLVSVRLSSPTYINGFHCLEAPCERLHAH